jgi:hypothetical protein
VPVLYSAIDKGSRQVHITSHAEKAYVPFGCVLVRVRVHTRFCARVHKIYPKERNENRKFLSRYTRRQQSSHWGRGLRPRHTQRLTALESQPLFTQLTQHSTQASKSTIHFSLCKRATSPARDVPEGTSHQARPKIDAGKASLLMGSIN